MFVYLSYLVLFCATFVVPRIAEPNQNESEKEKEKKKIELTDKFHFLIASFISTANTYVMRVVIQKVKNASVTVDEKVISSYVFENEVQFARNSPQTSILTLNSSIKELVKD